MLEDGIRVTSQTEESRYDVDGTRTAYIRVAFYVGKHGPFTVRLDRDGFTADKRDDAVNTFAREVRIPS